MNWKTTTATLLIAGAIALAGREVFAPRRLTPSGVLADVKRRTSKPSFNENAALLDLQRALDEAAREGDSVTVIRILKLRSEVLEGLGSLEKARADLQRIIDDYRPDQGLEFLIADILFQEGAYEQSLERVDELLGKVGNHSDAWRLRGRIEVSLGEQFIQRAKALTRSALLTEQSLEVVQILSQLAGRDEKEAERAVLKHALRDYFLPRREDVLEQVMDLADKASRSYTEARHAYAQSFGGKVHIEAVAGYLELLVAAGQEELAADFGMTVRRLPAVAKDDRTAQILLDVLGSLGRQQSALELIRSWNWEDVPVENMAFCEAACRTFYEARSWQLLTGPLIYMRSLGGDREQSLWFFYQGIRAAAKNRNEMAVTHLDKYIHGKHEEPFPGAVGLAYLALATAHRAMDSPREEREALEGAIQAPGETHAPALLRLVELQLAAPNSGFGIPERRFTRAMCLMPRRTAELMPKWAEIGEKELASNGHDFDDMVERLRSTNRNLPAFKVGPYTRFRIAERRLQGGSSLVAIRITRELLDEYPGLIPAMDVSISAYLSRGHVKRASELVLERLRLVGLDAQTVDYLEELGEGFFSPKQVLEAMRVDPTRTGRLVIARHLIDDGQAERALHVLQSGAGDVGESKRVEASLIAARALIDLDRHEAAVGLLQSFIDAPQLRDRALARMVEARLGANDPEHLEALVDRLAALETPDKRLVLGVVDHLLSSHHVGLAMRLLERLDAEPETRGGDVFARLALASALQFDRDGALEALERSEAFIDDGTPVLTRIVFAIEDRSWAALPELVAELRASGFQSTKLQDAMLALLEERTDAAGQMAEAGLAGQPRSADWALVRAAAHSLAGAPIEFPPYFGADVVDETNALFRGRGDVARDPRVIIGLLLSADLQGWMVWVAPRLLRLAREEAGSLWPSYLGARAMSALGFAEDAQVSLERLNGQHPTFGPGWDASEALLRDRLGDVSYHPDLVEFRKRRLRALGLELSGSSLENAVDRASARAAAQDLRQAVEILKRALAEAGPDAVYGRDLLARLCARRGDYPCAVAEFARVCDALPPSSDDPLIAEYLALLRAASDPADQSQTPLGSEYRRQALERLHERFPTDPLVALELAKHELASGENRTIAVLRAMRLLEDLRQASRGVPLEALRRGSTQLWVSFLLDVDPERALSLVQNDLQQRPGDLDLWLLEARTTVKRGDDAGAFELYEALVDMTSDPEALYGLAWLLAERGAPLGKIKPHLLAADQGELSARSLFIWTRMDMQSQKPNFKHILRTLQQLWTNRARLPELDVDPLFVGRTFAAALIRRATPMDFESLRRLLPEIASYLDDPYSPDLVLALDGVGANLAKLTSQATARRDGRRADAGVHPRERQAQPRADRRPERGDRQRAPTGEADSRVRDGEDETARRREHAPRQAAEQGAGTDSAGAPGLPKGQDEAARRREHAARQAAEQGAGADSAGAPGLPKGQDEAARRREHAARQAAERGDGTGGESGGGGASEPPPRKMDEAALRREHRQRLEQASQGEGAGEETGGEETAGEETAGEETGGEETGGEETAGEETGGEETGGEETGGEETGGEETGGEETDGEGCSR